MPVTQRNGPYEYVNISGMVVNISGMVVEMLQSFV